ncbi:MAG TPA: hypothetical protein VOA87_07340 [Thermoanaerobaculia bacterium]|nr:hypothetical protein [Thermoanaerobaculia bacterium]
MNRTPKVSLVAASLISAFLVVLSPSSSLAATLAAQDRAELTASRLVTPAMVEALEHHEHVAARIYFLAPAPAGEPLKLSQPPGKTQVSPVVLELAQAMLPGKLSLLNHMFLEALQGTVDARVVSSLLHNPHVLSIDVDNTALPEREEVTLVTRSSCVPSSIVACVQGGRYSIQITFPSAAIATSSSESAVFWFYSPTNWEVVAKVLNGCAINNHFWVFSAGATSSAYTLIIKDYVTGRSAAYNGAFCPITDTGLAFPCS